jgi:hypothetical protein
MVSRLPAAPARRPTSPPPAPRARRTTAPPRALVGFLKPYDPAIRKLALGLRALVLGELTPCHESIYDAYSAVAIGYGPTGRLSEDICHIAVYAKHVNLGLNRGTLLPDPQGVLKGTGTWIRHITLGSTADLARPDIKAFLRAACAEAGHRPRRLKNPTVLSTVKRIYARKRRPR